MANTRRRARSSVWHLAFTTDDAVFHVVDRVEDGEHPMFVGHHDDVRLRDSGKILHDLTEITIAPVML